MSFQDAKAGLWTETAPAADKKDTNTSEPAPEVKTEKVDASQETEDKVAEPVPTTTIAVTNPLLGK